MHLEALQLRSEMSGFIVRIAATACLLVFLYSRLSSADFWNMKVAPVVDLPDDPNDPYYNSKSFFFTAVEYL